MFVQYQRQTTKLTIAFVLIVGMMFLVPVITGKALALTISRVFRTNVYLFNGSYKLDAGMFLYGYVRNPVPPPEAYHNDTLVGWWTAGSNFPLIPGAKKGSVKYDVYTAEYNTHHLGTVYFYFSNPANGQNTCSVVTEPPPYLAETEIKAKCYIQQTSTVIIPTPLWLIPVPIQVPIEASFCVWYNSHSPYCPETFPISSQDLSHFAHVVSEKEKKVHTPHSGKTVVPHQITVKKMQATMAVSTPKTASSVPGGTSSKVTPGVATQHKS